MAKKTTQGIHIEVDTEFLPDHSEPGAGRYVFAYTIEIRNDGDAPARLETRHWVITDSAGRVEEVKGRGVVGETPYLEPGQSFQYTSGCVLDTPRGTMHGSYQMTRDDGDIFDAEIPLFVLVAPISEPGRFLN